MTFTFSNADFQEASTVHLVGDFNEWDEKTHPMKKLKNGSFKVALNLDTGSSYRFRYLVDENSWTNDGEADSYEPTGISYEENGVIAI